MSSTQELTATKRVRRQYEALPYPQRNPEDDKRLLFVTGLDDLGAINFYCFRGQRNFQRGFRVLIAGGGTGDAVMFLSHQLHETDARITYLDMSEASLSIARARAANGKMPERIDWRLGSLLDLPRMDLGQFDYINCSGVLHHLEDPAAGLAALKSVLKPDGAMGLMVYARHGRTGVYQMQELLRQVCGTNADPAEMVAQARSLLATLPPTNWFHRSSDLFPLQMDDAELCDLLLHARDRAYTMTEVTELVTNAGMFIAEHTCDQRALHDPALAFADPLLRSAIEGRPIPEQQSAAELFWGSKTKHSFWITSNPDSKTDLADSENVPFFSRRGLRAEVHKSLVAAEGQQWVHTIPHNGGIDVTLRLQVVPAAKRFIELIDDRRTMGEIVAKISADYDPVPPAADVWRTCLFVLNTLFRGDYIYLRHRTVQPFITD